LLGVAGGGGDRLGGKPKRQGVNSMAASDCRRFRCVKADQFISDALKIDFSNQ
jgi:hypothetical protein